MKTEYTLLSGETVEFATPVGELGDFLRRVLAAAKEPSVTEADLNDLVFGPENPLLNRTVMAGRSVATAEVYRDPIFHVMLDCIARKRRPTEPAASSRARYTMTVPDAAQQLGISESAVRQAIYAGRLRASKEGGTYYLDPRSVGGYRVSKRGPRRQDQAAKGPPGGVLDARIGSGPDASFRVKHSRDEFELTERHGAEWTGTIPPGWRRIAILGTTKERSRYWEIEPAEGESVLHFEGFYLRGGFRIVETVSTSQRAEAAFKAFQPR
ncbi:helix-turn-helix domain-containing protein [Sorangium sp. So ce1036]|uniref:helix-turn-helix domain-containing protein n=1 Tax=Sorangium sp. So ce1036 TaxID=3133328 RepID=UPI003F01198C